MVDSEPESKSTQTSSTKEGAYITVQPADEPLSFETIRTQFERLHRVCQSDEDRSLVHRLVTSEPPPATIECLLVSQGGSNAAIEFHFGIENGDLSELKRVLRALFPDSYELSRAHLDLETLSPHPEDTGSPPEPDSQTQVENDQRHPYIAGVEFTGRATRRNDWQTQLKSFETFQAGTDSRVPLAGVLETMADTPIPMVYQALLRPKTDWTQDADARHTRLRQGNDTRGKRLGKWIDRQVNPEAEDTEGQSTASTHSQTDIQPSDQQRLEELKGKDTRRSFAINARAVALAPDDPALATGAIEDLTTAFSGVSHTTYEIEGRVSTDDELHTETLPPGAQIFAAIQERRFQTPDYERLATQLPWTKNTSPAIVADAREAPSFCLIDGPALTAMGTRALATRPGERTALPRPPDSQLETYRTSGFTVGRARTQDNAPGASLAVPPRLQPLHIGWFGKTGSGKSTSMTAAMLDNHAATTGADILIEPKGDGMAVDYLRSHYARFGTLENVHYFDCSRVLPALSFFDIRDDLAAGIPRTSAVEDTVDHYLDILTQVMGKDRFEQAVRAPDVIRYLIKAQFDPEHGEDAFDHQRLHTAARRFHDQQRAPTVSDDDLKRMLEGIAANDKRSFDRIMQGVANRLEKIPIDQRLARMFDHVPREPADPHFDLTEILDEDAVVIFSLGGLRSEAQRVLTLTVLSNLWSALKRRSRQAPNTDHPLVNLYVEEAASVATSDLLSELLAEARGFDCSLTLSTQFPAQLREDGRAYDELLNNVSTMVVGNVPVDQGLTRRLATDDMPPEAVGNRLRALERGEWVAKLPADFESPEPRPFLLRSSTPPSGHPASTQPLDEKTLASFEDALSRLHDRTRTTAGLTVPGWEPNGEEEPTSTDESASESEADETEDEQPARRVKRVDSALPHTRRFPACIEYNAERHAVICGECANRYDPTIDGLRRAIGCCHDIEAVDRDDIPVCSINLKLSPEERAATGFTDRQLCFLQVVHNAQQGRYSDLEYDITTDSMVRLREYVGIETDAIDPLIEAEHLIEDTDHPHRLYSVTAAGRDLLGESYRDGLDFGEGKGDLTESSPHVLAVERARRYLITTEKENPDSPVVEVRPYYETEGDILDLVGLDADGEVVVAVEAERSNNDRYTSVPDDFDKMAACEPDHALWVVMHRDGAHDVLNALNNPTDGEPRVEKTYAAGTPSSQFTIDAEGLTEIATISRVQTAMEEGESLWKGNRIES